MAGAVRTSRGGGVIFPQFTPGRYGLSQVTGVISGNPLRYDYLQCFIYLKLPLTIDTIGPSTAVCKLRKNKSGPAAKNTSDIAVVRTS